ncbi:MAG TPA: hypothetical protein VHZ73_07720 [Vicinamibacterales bacterium]|nr:hypothetical protein [Vicinamibacterales bacterium]
MKHGPRITGDASRRKRGRPRKGATSVAYVRLPEHVYDNYINLASLKGVDVTIVLAHILVAHAPKQP